VFPASGFFISSMALPLSVVSQHRCPFVFEVLIKQLSIRSIIIRWCYPFPWYNAWESDADAGGSVEIARGWAASELFTEVGCKVIAVLGQEVVGCALELV